MRSLLAAAAGRSDLARAHQVADVLLQELVVAVEFVVFLLDSLYSVEDHEERILKCLGVPKKEEYSVSSGPSRRKAG